MDGIDGIAGIETICVAIGASVLILVKDGSMLPVFWLSLLTSLVAGFLVWNWPPAKIFMGDVGSGFLGYVFGMFVILTAVSGSLSLWSWLVLLGVFVADSTVTI